MPPRKRIIQPQLDPMRYLKARGPKWHYVRRVPGHFSLLDDRGTIQVSLKTSSVDVAKLRRDALERADDLFWQGLVADQPSHAQYAAAKARAIALGFEYKAAADIAASSTVEEIIRRITAAAAAPRDEIAALGGADEPRLTVRQVLTLYSEEIAADELQGMSETQVRKWGEIKSNAVEQFCAIVGDKALLDITRDDAHKFHRHYLDRVKARDLSGNTANRQFGNMRKLFREYTKYMQIDVQNPFEKLSYADPKRHRKIVPPFETAYIRDTFLKGEALHGLNREARLIFLAMVETGCRPSELCNIRPENIHLDAAVPYLSVTFVDDRRLKTENSARVVPLVGVSLEAMKRAKNGFPRYFDKESNFSAAAMKFLRENELLPTVNHRVYSLRHSYEKRMLEGGMDDEFRRRTLGHDTNRPEYGDGGALTWRAEQMGRIALPFDKGIFD